MADAAPHIEPFFLDSAHGRLFCVYLRPRDREPSHTLLYLHPFAEEMHKSRRMAALQARALAAAGYAVLQPDLTGCGDSDGNFGTANWQIWQEDARCALRWLAQHHPGPHSLWGLRLGASLAAELAHQEALSIERLILWQPILSGELFLNQFLRIQLASEMLSTGETQSGTKQLRARLDAGETLEIGGYALAPAMARALAAWKLIEHAPSCRTDWFDIGNVPLAPASQRVVEAWRATGVDLDIHSLTGDPFWLTQEISECPELILATLRTLTA